MKVKCEYCGAHIDRTAEKCENCGAVNLHQMRSGDGVPKTIEELLAFAKEKNLPLEDMRFFIGEDYREPRAFGIYKDPSSGNFVVYKNKSDGSRVIRYEGTDEAYAVNELYQKMRSEVMEQKADLQAGSVGKHAGKSGAGNRSLKLFAIVIIVVLGLGILSSSIFNVIGTGDSNSNGYYYNDDYDTDYYDDNSYWDWDYGGDDDTYYNDYDSWADDWDDDDWDWDSGDSWDSGGSDWDSDW